MPRAGVKAPHGVGIPHGLHWSNRPHWIGPFRSVVERLPREWGVRIFQAHQKRSNGGV